MPITTLSRREFSRNPSKVKRAAQRPVFIIERERPTHVLLTIQEYLRIIAAKLSMGDLLAMHQAEDIKFQPPSNSNHPD